MLNVDEIDTWGQFHQHNLRAAFTPVTPQSVRTHSSCQYLFTLLGSARAKAAHRTLMKLTPGQTL